MDIKTLLDDIDAAIAQRWGAPDRCPRRSEITELVATLRAVQTDSKACRNAKQLCAKAFGPAKAAGGDIDALKREMQQISDQLNALEQRRKDIEQQLLGLFSDQPATAPRASLPQRLIAAVPELTVDGTIDIVAATAADAAAWDSYVAAHPGASVYHRYVWRTIVTEAFGHESFYWVARDSQGVVRGVLPIVRLRSRLFGDFGVSLPFFNYGGVLADNSAIAAQLLQRAANGARTAGMSHLEVRHMRPVGDWPARTDKVSMILPLPGDVDQFAAQLGSKLRSQVNRARQQNAEVRIGHFDLLDDFYAVFAHNMRDLGTPVYGRNFFATILRHLPEQAHIVVVRMDGRPVAAAFLLGDGDLMEIPWASTLRSVNALNMNMRLYWEVLTFAIARGYSFFDFGRSTRDAGTFRFKKQWGAQPVQHHWQYWLANGGPLPELKPDSPKFRLLIACWQRLPVFVTKLIGPAIVKNLP